MTHPCSASQGHFTFKLVPKSVVIRPLCVVRGRPLNLTLSYPALHQAVASLCGLAEAEDWDNFVEQLLLQHYDAAYEKARRRHQQAASQQRAKHPKRQDGSDAGSSVEMSTSQSVSDAFTTNTPGDSGRFVQPNMHLLSLPNMNDDVFSQAALNLLRTHDPAAVQIE